MRKKKIAIIGSHGLYANYGGWDQLVRKLAEEKSEDIEYLIFNSADSPKDITIPSGVEVRWLQFKAAGFQGLFFDFWSLLSSFLAVDGFLLLGVQGMPIIPFLRLIKKNGIVANVGGIEWERPKFGYFSKLYLKFCFRLSFKYSNYVILDNQYYDSFTPPKHHAEVRIVPYGGEIDTSLELNDELRKKYPFIEGDYFLSVSRSLEDNQLEELCRSFLGSKNILVLISNFSKSDYGISVLSKYVQEKNFILIDGLYVKPELDLLRRRCKAYIHTHTLCGTAPSLVEMVISRRPIISYDKPQNRFTLDNQGMFFSSFDLLQESINKIEDYSILIPTESLCASYNWKKIVVEYESMY